MSSSIPVKHYRLRNLVETDRPDLVFEINMQLQDVQSGYRESANSFFKASWLEDRELGWAQDMVCKLEEPNLEEIAPPLDVQWPDFSEEKIVRHLVRYFFCPIWKNYALGIYSHSSESREEFIQRCRDLLSGQRLEQLKKFQDVFVHRFLELREKLVKDTVEGDWDEVWKRRRLIRIRELFSVVQHDLSRWTADNQDSTLPMEVDWRVEEDPALQDRLDDLREEFATAIGRIHSESEQEAKQIEVYEVPVTSSQIEIVSKGIIWNSTCKEDRN